MLLTEPAGITLLGGVVMVAIFSLKTKADEQPLAPNLLLVRLNFQLPISGFLSALLQPPPVDIDKIRIATRDASLAIEIRRVDWAKSFVIAVSPFEAVQIFDAQRALATGAPRGSAA
jgi:hypothetical protein